MTVAILNYDEAHKFVDETLGARWDGFDIVVWRENPAGWMKPVKRFRNGGFERGAFNAKMPAGRRWGVETRYVPDSKGTWKVKVREPRRTPRA